MRILLIEDNSALADLIITHLIGFYVLDQVDSFQKARYLLDTRTYDLLIVDLDSTDDNGYVLCHYLRDKHVGLPVLILTAVLSVEQKLNCLKRGADYLMKPFNILELVTKAKSLLRKDFENGDKKLAKIDLELDQLSHKAYIGGKEVALNRKEFSLLELFLCHPKQVLSKAMLSEKIWRGDRVLMGNAIETTISHLRKKIGKDFIKTIKGVGYTIR